MSFRTDMINSEIPKNYTLNPSSFSGTPQLTINHDVAAELDSTNAFEGTMSFANFIFCVLIYHRTGEAAGGMVQRFIHLSTHGDSSGGTKGRAA